MAQRSRHASLRFSVFEVAFDVGLQSHQLDGQFDPIVEGDESEVRVPPLGGRYYANAYFHFSVV